MLTLRSTARLGVAASLVLFVMTILVGCASTTNNWDRTRDGGYIIESDHNDASLTIGCSDGRPMLSIGFNQPHFRPGTMYTAALAFTTSAGPTYRINGTSSNNSPTILNFYPPAHAPVFREMRRHERVGLVVTAHGQQLDAGFDISGFRRVAGQLPCF